MQTLNTHTFREAVESALGFPVAISARETGGVLEALDVTHLDGTTLSPSEQQQVGVLYAAHDPNQLSASQQREIDAGTQHDLLQVAVLPHLNQLRGLAPDAAMYALLARFGAIFNGEDQATIDAILDRQSAGNYIQSTAQWAGLSAAQRQWAILELEMIAGALQVIIGQL